MDPDVVWLELLDELMAKTLLNAAIEIETMEWLQQVQQASLMSWDGFIDCVLKVGLEGFEAITGVTERQMKREEEE
jgi:hypothetical protein